MGHDFWITLYEANNELFETETQFETATNKGSDVTSQIPKVISRNPKRSTGGPGIAFSAYLTQPVKNLHNKM